MGSDRVSGRLWGWGGAEAGDTAPCPPTPGKCPLWGRRTPGAPGNIPETLGCKARAGPGAAQGWGQDPAPPPSAPPAPVPPPPAPSPPVPILPDALGHVPHGLLRDEDVAGEAAQHRVLGDEPEVAAGRGQGERGGPPFSPHGGLLQHRGAPPWEPQGCPCSCGAGSTRRSAVHPEVREQGVSPAVPGVAPAEGDVLHLEEVAAALKLQEKTPAGCGCPAGWGTRTGTPCPRRPRTSSSRPYSLTVRMSLMPCSVISRSQLAGGRKCTVSFLVVAIWGRGDGASGRVVPVGPPAQSHPQPLLKAPGGRCPRSTRKPKLGRQQDGVSWAQQGPCMERGGLRGAASPPGSLTFCMAAQRMPFPWWYGTSTEPRNCTLNRSTQHGFLFRPARDRSGETVPRTPAAPWCPPQHPVPPTRGTRGAGSASYR